MTPPGPPEESWLCALLPAARDSPRGAESREERERDSVRERETERGVGKREKDRGRERGTETQRDRERELCVWESVTYGAKWNVLVHSGFNVHLMNLISLHLYTDFQEKKNTKN